MEVLLWCDQFLLAEGVTKMEVLLWCENSAGFYKISHTPILCYSKGLVYDIFVIFLKFF